jgi:hypothetical protein
MTDDLLARLAQLNPVADPDRLVTPEDPGLPAHPVLRAILEQARAIDGQGRPTHRTIDTEVTNVSTISPSRGEPVEPSPPPPRSPARWLVAAASVAVILVGGVAIVTVGSDRGDPAGEPTEPTTPTESAEAYLAARADHDGQAARSLLADDADITEATFVDVTEVEPAFEMMQLFGFDVTPYECETPAADVSPTDAVDIRCTYTLDSTLQQVVGRPPIESRYQFTVEDGLIVDVINMFPYDEFGPAAWQPFVDWLERERPGDHDFLFREIDGFFYPRLTQEVFDLMPVVLEEYADAQDG